VVRGVRSTPENSFCEVFFAAKPQKTPHNAGSDRRSKQQEMLASCVWVWGTAYPYAAGSEQHSEWQKVVRFMRMDVLCLPQHPRQKTCT